MADFPQSVNVQPAYGVAGDFANDDPYSTVYFAGPGFVAGANGLVVGAFAWADPVNQNELNNTGVGLPLGFIKRPGLNADITVYLAGSSLLIPPGKPVAVHNSGSFLVTNSGSTASQIGNKAYANYANGLITFAPTGTPPTSASATGATLAKIVSASTGGALPVTNTAVGSIAGNILTIASVGTGSVAGPGVISGPGIDPNTAIVQQLTGGTAGGAGTYQVSIAQTVPAGTAITLFGGGLTLTGANTSGVFAVGQTISGTNIPTGTTITAYGTGTAGGAGTYQVSNVAGTAATASTITAANAMFLTVDASSTGAWQLNDLLTGSGVATGQSIAATGAQNPNLTSLGGAGTYLTNLFQSSALSAQTIGVNAGIELKWAAQSVGQPGEVVAMSSYLLG